MELGLSLFPFFSLFCDSLSPSHSICPSLFVPQSLSKRESGQKEGGGTTADEGFECLPKNHLIRISRMVKIALPDCVKGIWDGWGASLRQTQTDGRPSARAPDSQEHVHLHSLALGPLVRAQVANAPLKEALTHPGPSLETLGSLWRMF